MIYKVSEAVKRSRAKRKCFDTLYRFYPGLSYQQTVDNSYLKLIPIETKEMWSDKFEKLTSHYALENTPGSRWLARYGLATIYLNDSADQEVSGAESDEGEK